MRHDDTRVWSIARRRASLGGGDRCTTGFGLSIPKARVSISEWAVARSQRGSVGRTGATDPGIPQAERTFWAPARKKRTVSGSPGQFEKRRSLGTW